jgi:uncharacterized protein (TIGR00730 family)
MTQDNSGKQQQQQPHSGPRSISLADEDAVKDVLVRSVFGLWGVVNELTQLRPSKRDRYRVTIFGSARSQPGAYVYDMVKRMAAGLAVMGCDVITGGGPGLMRAANEGARSVGAAESSSSTSVGIRIELPFEQEVNPFVEKAFEHKTFFTRLHHFVMASDAFVVAPGGVGTVLELMMIWQLLQVKHVQQSPLILVGKMWPSLVVWARDHMLGDQPLADAADMAIPRCVNTADEAIALVREHLAAWRASAAATPPQAQG